MNFKTGNSGNSLREAVIKIGPGCQQEGAFCQFLGPDIAPEIYAILPDGYIMESLTPAPRSPQLLRRIEQVLQEKVWSRPALPISNDISWIENLKEFGVNALDCWVQSEPCLVHGDPTASNALIRTFSYFDDQLILCDPRPPRDFIPQTRETDMGRIIQSYLGWEVAAYGLENVKFLEPYFMQDVRYRVPAMFWCGAAAARIEFLERSRANRPYILEWCQKTRNICHV